MNGRSGYSVGGVLQQGVQGLNGRLQECINGVAELNESVTELVARRSQVFLELAEHYLPTIDQQSVSDTFQEVRSQLMEVLMRKQKHEREIQKSLEAGTVDAEQLERDLNRLTVTLNEKVEQREELEKIVAERLDQDVEFQRLSREALVAEKELNRNERRVSDMQEEAAGKLPSYQESVLFQYLHKRGYGTSGYNKKGLTKRLDGWVARMIDYHRARRGYEFLRVTPELMAQEVGRRRDQFNALMELVEACEDRHSDAVGLTSVMREGQELGKARDNLVADMSKQQDRMEKQRQELEILTGSRNEYYEQAVTRMRDFLAGLESWRLEHASRATPEPQDDQIVAEVNWIGSEVEKTKQHVRELTSEQEMWKRRVYELQDIWLRFRRADYDSARSLFHPGFDIEGIVESFVRGQTSRDDLWSAIRAAQQFAPPWYDDQNRPRGRQPVETDFSHVLLRVLTEIAGAALRHAVERGMERRGPIRQQQRVESGRPKFRPRGFTSGRGF